MKTKTLIIAALIGFLCASCVDENIKLNYEFTNTKITTSIPFSKNSHNVSIRKFIEEDITENESNYIVMSYTAEISELINDTLFITTSCCTKKVIIKAD